MVPNDLTMAEFMYVIRKRIKISPDKSIFMFVENLGMVPTSHTINQIYEEGKIKTVFIYKILWRIQFG